MLPGRLATVHQNRSTGFAVAALLIVVYVLLSELDRIGRVMRQGCRSLNPTFTLAAFTDACSSAT